MDSHEPSDLPSSVSSKFSKILALSGSVTGLRDRRPSRKVRMDGVGDRVDNSCSVTHIGVSASRGGVGTWKFAIIFAITAPVSVSESSVKVYSVDALSDDTCDCLDGLWRSG